MNAIARPLVALPFVEDDGGRAAAGYRGKVGDCVVRAIVIAGRLGYADVYAELMLRQGEWYKRSRSRRARGLRAKGTAGQHATPRTGVMAQVYRPWLAERGWAWTPTMTIGSGCTTHPTPAEVPAEGRHVLRISKHLSALIDGTIRDLWLPGADRCVYGYWTAP